MADRLLVALDGEEQSRAALEHALAEHPDAALVGVCVIDPRRTGYRPEAGNVASGEEWYENATAKADAILAEAATVVEAHGVEFTTTTRVGKPAAEIVAAADEHETDGIVMGSHGRTGVSRVLLGSVAETVVRRSTMPVTVVR